VMTLEARFNEGQFDPVARGVAPIDGIIADTDTLGLNVMIDEPEAARLIQSVLARFREDGSVKTKGEIKITALNVDLPDARQDIEIDIGDGWPVSPKIKGALKSLPGVVLVEDA